MKTSLHLCLAPVPGGRSYKTDVYSLPVRPETIENECVPTQLAQCWFPGLAIFNAKISIYFSNKIYGSTFIKQQSETVMV